MRLGWILVVLLLVIGLAPVASMLLASALAHLGGCVVNEAFPQPCVMLGSDWGGTLNWLFTNGWLIFLTAPAAIAGCALGIGLAVVSLVRRARN